MSAFAFVLSRVPVFLPTTQTKVNSILDKAKIDRKQLRTLSIITCPKELLPALPKGGGGLLGGLTGLIGAVVNVVTGLLGSVLNLVLD